MLHRFVVFLCLLALLAAAPARASVPAFTFADVQARAQDLATLPYAEPPSVPEFLMKLSSDAWNDIRFRPEKALWASEELPFTVQFFHPGLLYDRPVRIHIINQDAIADIAFDTALFQYGSETLAQQTAAAKGLNFAGFRIHYPLNRSDYKDEVAVFLGASYFRALAKGNSYGIYARGLALDTACASGEEFPYFREFWIERPSADAASITIYALMDSPSLSGAYRFIIKPGSPTIMDVKCALFTRKGAKNFEKIGLAPLTSMFFYGEEKNGRPNDFRPEVHNSDGLLFSSGPERWIWSPLSNPKRLSINTFPLTSPRGFGLFQRDGDFKSYQDLDSRYEKRPSLWVIPEGDWGSGTLNLVEIPTEDEMHDNIVAFWCPEKPAANPDQSDAARCYPAMQQYSWKLFWMLPDVAMHDLGQVSSTRISRRGDTMTFHVDFEGGMLADLAPDTGLASVIDVPEFIPVIGKKLTYNPENHGWRLDLTIRLPKESGVIESLMSARKGPLNLRFRALLKQGENLPQAITEIWTYDWQFQPQ